MTVPDRRQILAWLGLLGLVAASLAFASYRLRGLPDLGITLGPDLQVRSVSNPVFSESDQPKFKPGDLFVALEGNTLDALRELRVVLQALPWKAKLGEGADDTGLRYQIVRRDHRYTVAIQRDSADPLSLPPRFNPETDRLVEIDGREWPKPVGPEGVRSIINDRDFIQAREEILLTFQRKNAVRKGHVVFAPSGLTWSAALLFALVFGFVAVLWRYHADTLPTSSALSIGAETVAFGWILMLALTYQWLLSDWLLASLTVAGLSLVRPFAIFARTKTVRHESDAAGWWALGIGAMFAMLVIGLLNAGLFQDAEMALYAGASATALYLVYELFVVAFDDAPEMTLQEGSGYLAGILMVGIATALFVWRFETDVFLHNLWRWFTVAFVALVWFGDALFCLRGPSAGGYGDMLTEEERHDGIREYLAAIEAEIPESRVAFVVTRGDVAATVSLEEGDIAIEPSEETLADAVSIAVREKTQIPMPETVDRGSHPLAGIAQTMNLVLTLPLQAPPGGMELPDAEIVLVAIERDSAGDLPSFVSIETMERAQKRLDASTWTSIFIEAMTHFSEMGAREVERVASVDESAGDESASGKTGSGETGSGETEPDVDPERVEELEASLERAEERIAMLREDRRSLADQLEMTERRIRGNAPPVDAYETLLEPELIETLEYLVEQDEPIAVEGPVGAGKEFTSRCASYIEGQPPESFVVYDAADEPSAKHRQALFGDRDSDDESEESGLVETAVGGSLLVRSASHVADTILIGLCNAASERGFRLYLSFDARQVESHSPLDERSSKLAEKLEHRELLIPHLQRRRSILPNILNFYLERYAERRNAAATRFSDEALEALREYTYPGQLREAKLIVDVAVLRSSGEIVEFGDLYAEVRAATEAPHAESAAGDGV